MVFAHRLECDQTDDGAVSSILVPSIVWKLPLLVITALVKHGVVTATSASPGNPPHEGPSSSSALAEDHQDTTDYSHLHDTGATILPPLAFASIRQRPRSGSFSSHSSGRWEPTLPTIDEDRTPQQESPQYHNLPRYPAAIVAQVGGNHHYNKYGEESNSLDAPAAVVTLAIWLPAILWAANLLWFSVEQARSAVGPSSSSCRAVGVR